MNKNNTDPTVAAVRTVLQRFQDGYTRRDTNALDAFMALFVPDDSLEIIGTNASHTSREEWCLGPEMARDLIESDWLYWGDVWVDMDAANIHVLGDVAWLAAPGTVSMHIDADEEYEHSLEDFMSLFKQEGTPRKKLLRIQLDLTNTFYEIARGEEFVWPFRFTAVLVQRDGRWLFHQMQFSFPTTRFPDERILPEEG